MQAQFPASIRPGQKYNKFLCCLQHHIIKQKKEKNLNKKSGKKPGLGTEKKSEKIKRRKCMKKGEKMQKDKNRTVKIRFKLTKMQETIDEMSKVVYNSN